MIIVTGASRGLGQAITERLVENGEVVLGLARNTGGMNIDAIECDVSDYASVKNASKEVKRMKKPVKAFVNAAGVASMNMAVTTDESTVQKLIQTNLVGTIYCCQLFAPIMLRQKQGSFINFSTIAVALALKGESVYAASKAGLVGMSKSLAIEYGKKNIKVAKYALFGSKKLSNNILNAIKGSNSCLISNHGQISLGSNLSEAYELANEVEQLCEYYYYCKLQKNPKILNNKEMESVLSKIKSYKSKSGALR